MGVQMRAALLLLALTATSCVSSPLVRTARVRGSQDLECPKEQVSAYKAEGGLIVACGCDHWIEYSCFYSHGYVCLRQSSPTPIRASGVERPAETSHDNTPSECKADPHLAWGR